MTAGRPILYYAIEDKHLTYECEEIVTLGRGPNMKISLPQEIPGISRHHATIRQEGSRWIIEDADSRNGTYVDRTRVKTQTLLDGCIIHLGTFPLKFHAPQRQAATVELTNPVSSRPSISFSDTFDVQPDASININDFSMSSPGRGFSGHDNAGTIEFDQAESSELRARWFGPQQAWSIDLFSELGKGLQVATNLDEMLENVLTLLFHQIKIADSAVILKVDPSGKNFQSLVQRSATGEEILVSRTVMNKAVAMRSSLLVHDAASDPQYETVESLRGSDVTSVICAPLSHENLIIGAIYIDARQRKILFGQRELEICTALSRFTAVAMDLFEQRNRVREQAKHRERLARYIGPSVVDRIVAAGDDNNMLADKEVVTVLFSDLRGFTKIAEHLPPQEVVALLNGIFGRLTDAVFRHNGTLDKFIGDGMMAFFGAPLKLPDPARQAVLAA
ncbi:MAG: FHA domain-containing protein, partial [Planctomycetota bacterium]|nr:FHA domain-containing protein [Planctomycetota bacterium]